MRTKYGLQVDAWGAFIPNRADLAEKVLGGVQDCISSRGLEGLDVSTGMLTFSDPFIPAQSREHLIVKQDIGDDGYATVALRVVQKGNNDLEVSWRLFEENVKVKRMWRQWQLGLLVGGIFMAITGLFLLLVGIGVFCFPVAGTMISAAAIWWFIGRSRTTATTYQQLDNRILAQAVDYCLMNQLSKKGVKAQEMRVLVDSQMSGLGRLEAMSPIDEVGPRVAT